MARYRGSVCRLCRREGEKLFLKGSRCYSEKCAIERRSFPPGQHGFNVRRKISDYGVQLREKQKVKRIYGLLEKQFHSYYVEAARQKGVTGENLLVLLETRLDNIVYRLGFAPSRRAARQLVRHRHFTVNDKIVDIPSYICKPGEIVKVRPKGKNLEVVHLALRESDRAVDLPWLRLNKANLEGELLEKPKRADIPLTVQEQLIVELYSK
ncbi:MAG: 30S ribosomal protein S4 [candidate division Zixibacteria bacterium]|jgi:small subunit ribosomal protein S4|nr:30S ribosomal protein S4 [candidate division Zixibacteria bacterium]